MGGDTGGVPGAPADYMSRLRDWLERHKRYPRRAQNRREEGVATLFLVIDRDGRVLDSRVKRSSGYKSLDRATMSMVKRAEPLPKMPPEMQRNRIAIEVPIQFALR